MSEPLAYLVGYLFSDLQSRVAEFEHIADGLRAEPDPAAEKALRQQIAGLKGDIQLIAGQWAQHNMEGERYE